MPRPLPLVPFGPDSNATPFRFMLNEQVRRWNQRGVVTGYRLGACGVPVYFMRLRSGETIEAYASDLVAVR